MATKQPITKKDLVETISKAIAQYEGYYKVEFSRAWRSNNPGNFRSWGKIPVVNGYCKFATRDDGWAALRTQVSKNVNRGLTFLEFFQGKPKVYPGFSPAADNNNPAAYASFVAVRVAKHFGTVCDPGTVIKSLINA